MKMLKDKDLMTGQNESIQRLGFDQLDKIGILFRGSFNTIIQIFQTPKNENMKIGKKNQ